jgi:hypothetical protein
MRLAHKIYEETKAKDTSRPHLPSLHSRLGTQGLLSTGTSHRQLASSATTLVELAA